MVAVIYGLCAITAMLCAVLLFRAYRRNHSRMLFWSGIGFAGLTLDNLVVMIDKIVLPLIDLSVLRHAIALLAMMVFLWGLIWETQ